ncbi:MAG: hypothetical protein V3V11_11400 [Vicinamibacteria bacterium]
MESVIKWFVDLIGVILAIALLARWWRGYQRAVKPDDARLSSGGFPPCRMILSGDDRL